MKQMKIKRTKADYPVLNSSTILVIRLPDSHVLRVMSRSVFLPAIIIGLLCIGSVFRGPSNSYLHEAEFGFGSESIDFKLLDLLLRDLVEAGVVKKGDRTLIVGTSIQDGAQNSQFLNEQKIDLKLVPYLDSQQMISKKGFDFVFFWGSINEVLVDCALKKDGIVAAQLSKNPFNVFAGQLTYRSAYLKRFGSTIVVIRKSDLASDLLNSSGMLRYKGLLPEFRKAALKGLEDAWLEPPRRALATSKEMLKRIKFRPDILGDPLDDYTRRVFINVGFSEQNENFLQWFNHNYPTRNQDFEVYNLQVVPQAELSTERLQIDVSDWLMKNVKKKEYVVMKAEAEVVEEMIGRRTIGLVDELFLECNNEWEDGEKTSSKRAYLECLALYGRLRDEGVAVHQWWG